MQQALLRLFRTEWGNKAPLEKGAMASCSSLSNFYRVFIKSLQKTDQKKLNQLKL
jgi:hypothetical protein